MSQIQSGEAKTLGRPWDIVLGWDLAPWFVKHTTVEGNYCKTKCFVAKAGCKAWILLAQSSPQPCSRGTIARVNDCQVLTLCRAPSAPFQSSPIKTNSPGGHLIISIVSVQRMAIYREI